MSLKFIAPLLCMTGSVFAVDITPRLSIGVAKGVEPTQSEFNKIPSSVGYTYNTNSALNIEVPVAISFRGDSPIYFVAAPAFVYSKNNNTFTFDTATVSINGNDNYSEVGGKLYAGLGFGGKIGFHCEILPYYGYASARNSGDSTTKNKSTGQTTSNAGSSSGSMALFGVTVGAYYAPEWANGFEIGARLGYAGANGTIDGGDVQQTGGLFALDVGWTI